MKDTPLSSCAWNTSQTSETSSPSTDFSKPETIKSSASNHTGSITPVSPDECQTPRQKLSSHVKELRPAAPALGREQKLTSGDLAKLVTGPSSLDVYVRSEDRLERCILGLPRPRAKEPALDPALARMLETL